MLLRVRFGLGSLLVALFAQAGACNPSFDPDWQPPGFSQVMPFEAGEPSNVPPADAGVDGAPEEDAASVWQDSGVQPGRLLSCYVNDCDGGAADCMPYCKAACAEVNCTPEDPCNASGWCLVVCKRCGVPPIK
jgi:hypothetical protein